jgi:hypothetical protein
MSGQGDAQAVPPGPLEGLIERVRLDVKGAYATDVIQAAAEIRQKDPGRFIELLRDLKQFKAENPKCGFSATVFNKLVDRAVRVNSALAGDQQTDIASLLVEMSLSAKLHFLVGDNYDVYADIEVELDDATYPATVHVQGRTYRRWLSQLFYEKYGRAVPQDAFKAAINTIEARTYAEKVCFQLFPRIAQVEEGGEVVIYLDRGSPGGEAFRIDHAGYTLVSDPPVKFIRPEGGIGELPIPEPGGKIDALEPRLNLRGRRDFVLSVGWILGCFQPLYALLIALLIGRHGSAKTSTLRRLCALIDPLVDEPDEPVREDREVVMVAQDTYVQAIDNVVNISGSRSATFCRMSTGGSQRGRILFTTRDTYRISARRPMIMTSLRQVMTAPDLIDRTAIIGMGPPFEEENAANRKSERSLDAAFIAEWPKLFGCILDAVTEGLRYRRAGEPMPVLLPRMADFASWTYCCEGGLGWERGTILKAYLEALDEYAKDIAELDPIAAGIIAFMLDHSDGWRGTVTMLGAYLTRMGTGGTAKRGRPWALDLKDLAAAIDELASVLFRNGLKVTRSHAGGKREIILTWVPGNRPNGLDPEPDDGEDVQPQRVQNAWRPRP